MNPMKTHTNVCILPRTSCESCIFSAQRGISSGQSSFMLVPQLGESGRTVDWFSGSGAADWSLLYSREEGSVLLVGSYHTPQGGGGSVLLIGSYSAAVW
jgi:hypothetical protein